MNYKSKIIILLLFVIFFQLTSKSKTELLVEAKYYTKLEKNYVRCDLCPLNCILKQDETGICNARKNIGGKLYSLVYNQPVAIHVDPIEKKPLFHFLPGSKILSIATAGCNLRCNFCQNWEISQSKPEEVNAYDYTPNKIIELAKKYNCRSIAFTYTEPTIFYEYMFDIAKLAKENGLWTVLVTCGYINEKPLRELSKYIDAANIDLKGFSDEFYQTYTTGNLQPVLNTIKLCQEEGIYFEITNLLIPGANDSDIMIRNMCKWIKNELGSDVPLHFSRFFPNYQLRNRPPTPLNTLLKARDIAIEEGIEYIYIGNISTDSEDTYCPDCKKKLIDRSGYLIEKNLIEKGKCPFCGKKIPGIFQD